MGGKHVLVISVPFQAHYAGIFRLSMQLAKRGITVSFVGLPDEIARLKTYDEVQELDFNLVPYKDFGASVRSNLTSFLSSVKGHFQPILDKLLDDQKAGLSGPTCVIGDRFYPWAKDIAKQLNIPYYQFFSCGAIYVRNLQAMFDLFADGTLPLTEETEGKRFLAEFEGPLEIPGLPALRWHEMTSTRLGAEYHNAIGGTIGEADAAIVNTFYELEAPQIDAIRQRWIDDPRGKSHQLFLVGPLSNAATFKDRSFVADLNNRGTNCLQWLDKQPPQSVIYICLGSITHFNSQNVKELAVAIEASEQRFLWVINRDTEAALPPDFVERTREKGLIVAGWVPQLQILAHSSTGGFVTHCGWNSIIESISAGLPMAAWPHMRTDQFVNCRYIVDVLKVAVEINPGFVEEVAEIAAFSTARKVILEEIVRVMRLLVSEEGKAMRSRAQVLKEKSQAAVADAGASQKALDDLVDSIPSSNVTSTSPHSLRASPVLYAPTEVTV